MTQERTFSAASKLDDLSEDQKKEIEQQSRPNAALIHETIRAEGESELERGTWSLGLSALAAGLSIGFSLVVQGTLESVLPEGSAREVIAPLGYTIGFLIVVLGRQQLFTENTLTPVLAFLHNRDLATFRQLLRLWGIVLVANVAGAILFATAVVHGGAFEANAMHSFGELGRQTISAPVGTTFMRAVYAGWLIALMVWLLPAAESSRAMVIIIITYIVALCRLSHIIAGSVDCAFLVLTGEATWVEFVTKFFVPTLIGNIVGGVALVAVLNFGQVAPEIE